MFVRFASVTAANRAKKRWDPTEDPEELKILKNHANIFTFKTFPWTLWILSFSIFLIAIYLNYFLWFIAHKDENNYLIILMTIILYYSSFFMIYAGKIELLTIDKKKGIIKYKLINIILSKIEKEYKIEDLDDIEILLKGKIRSAGDYTRYFIRLSFKDKSNLIFGECLTIRKASEKYRKSLAILKGVIMPDIIDKAMVTDETIDETSSLMN